MSSREPAPMTILLGKQVICFRQGTDAEISAILSLKSNLVAIILYDLAESHQMYPVLTEVTTFHNMTPDLTGFLRQLVLNPNHGR
jgi:hypothetical protein